MKKFLLSFSVFAISAVYAITQYRSDDTTVSSVNSTATSSVALLPVQSATSEPASQSGSNTEPSQAVTPTKPATPATPAPTTPKPAPTPTPVAKPQGQYVDGTYTGTPANAYYGMVKVQATIQNGKLTAVTFLQYPNDRRTSQYINSQAMPLLQREAIQAQSAKVSGVSGASDTSAAFRESLGNALAQAKN